MLLFHRLVPIEVLKTFNKLKVLTDGNEETIRDAAKTSKELRVSEDGKRIGVVLARSEAVLVEEDDRTVEASPSVR